MFPFSAFYGTDAILSDGSRLLQGRLCCIVVSIVANSLFDAATQRQQGFYLVKPVEIAGGPPPLAGERPQMNTSEK